MLLQFLNVTIKLSPKKAHLQKVLCNDDGTFLLPNDCGAAPGVDSSEQRLELYSPEPHPWENYFYFNVFFVDAVAL